MHTERILAMFAKDFQTSYCGNNFENISKTYTFLIICANNSMRWKLYDKFATKAALA